MSMRITSTGGWGCCRSSIHIFTGFGGCVARLGLYAAMICFFAATFAKAGPYGEAGVCGYVGSDRRCANPLQDADARINPIFRGWATGFRDYLPADTQWMGPGIWNDPNKALGPATGDNFDVVSLGDLDAEEIGRGGRPGQITLVFGDADDINDPRHIRDVNGYDFVVFENAFVSGYTTAGGAVRGQSLAEFGYVEVSSNGRDFVRFPSVSLTPEAVGPYGTVDITDIYNLAGKHPNAYGLCIGTAFDLSELAGLPPVSSGLVDVNNISCVRVVDIPGSGDFFDEARLFIDPCSWPQWSGYEVDNPIYDAWLTVGSGGADIEAAGVLHEQQYSADINLDGVADLADLELFVSAWQSRFGQSRWVGRCDLSRPRDLIVDMRDFAVFAGQWHKVEKWREP